MKLAFLVTEGLMCLYDKQRNAWLLVDMGGKLRIYTRPCIILYLLILYMKKLRNSDRLKTSAFSCNTSAKL